MNTWWRAAALSLGLGILAACASWPTAADAHEVKKFGDYVGGPTGIICDGLSMILGTLAYTKARAARRRVSRRAPVGDKQ